MGFRYLDKIATPEHVQQFLELADLALGAGQSAENVFLLSHRLRDSRPMQHCRKRLARNANCQALIDERRLCGPYNSEQLLTMPTTSTIGCTPPTTFTTSSAVSASTTTASWG